MTADRAVEAALRHDRIVVLASVLGIAGVAWAYLFWAAAHMPGMDAAMPHAATAAMDAGEAAFLARFLMWCVMMVGMMLPSAAPMILMYATIVRRNRERGTVLPAAYVFMAGYVIVWTGFSLAAAGAQTGLDRLALLSPMMVSASAPLSTAILVAAGIYQWLPIKDSCLRKCRSPLQFLTMRWRPDRGGALRMGLEHGAVCVGCCWALMLLLFVGGIMNLLWVAAIAGVVLVEKLLPAGRISARLAGVGLVGAGVWTMV